MKNILKLTLAAVALISFTAFGASAQKFGYIDSEELLRSMPEMADAEQKLETLEADQRKILDEMIAEFQSKASDYEANQSTYSETIKEAKLEELTRLEENMNGWYQQMEIRLRSEQQKLLEPMIVKARNGIHNVAKAGGYAAIFEKNSLLYFDESMLTDILPLVKKDLGIQ